MFTKLPPIRRRPTTPLPGVTHSHTHLHHAVHSNPDTILPVRFPPLPRPISFHNNLIAAHAAAGDLSSAQRVFDEMPQRNSISFNSIIAAHSRAGSVDDAWTLLGQMMAAGLDPSGFTLAPILSSHSLELARGAQLQSLILKTGLLVADPFSSTALVGHFVRHGRMEDAVKLFDEMPSRTAATWNCVISGFAQLGVVEDSVYFFRDLIRSGICPSECSSLGVLSGFKSSDCLVYVEQVHGLAIKSTVDTCIVVSNAFLNAYSNCFAVDMAERLFKQLPVKDLVSWNTMIAAFAKSEIPERALDVFFSMQLERVWPSETTFATVLGACIEVNVTEYGELLHAKTIKHNFNTSLFVGSLLVEFYAKCTRIEDARRLFHEIPDKNAVTWNAMLSGYLGEGSLSTIMLFKEMLNSGFRPNEFSFSSSLKRASVSDLLQLHSLIIRLGYDSNEYISSAIIASYATYGMISDALACAPASTLPFHAASSNVIASVYNKDGRYKESKDVLLQLYHPDTISWNILITACVRNGDYLEAFQLFKLMQSAGYLLDNYTAVSLLSICSKANSLHLGSLLHGLIIKANSGYFEVFVHNVLINMYAKCGNLEGCVRAFEEMNDRNIISWTALISGLGLHGCTREALKKFKQMESSGLKPDRVAFIVALAACRHGGLVEEGIMLLEQMMSVYGIEPEMDHYTCVVDLLCRFGHIKEADQVISSMPFQPNAAIWRTFLQGCKRYPCFTGSNYTNGLLTDNLV